ncbi:hypothetical protein ACFQY7_07075 [Actinomadura luteofluorescens]|uniref:hypothetical protein n=1 Tax=Actinomadura luteofluorescens TaxID=46163 RepID=UPI003642792C
MAHNPLFQVMLTLQDAAPLEGPPGGPRSSSRRTPERRSSTWRSTWSRTPTGCAACSSTTRTCSRRTPSSGSPATC